MSTYGYYQYINCRFFSNQAAIYSGYGWHDLLGCVIHDNENGVGTMTNGPYQSDRQMLVINCTFARNGGVGLRTLADYPALTVLVANSTFWGNGDHGTQILADYLSHVIVDYCVVENGSAGVGRTSWGGYTLGTIYGQNPNFADENGPDGVPGTVDDNFIPIGSPCVDAALPDYVPDDLAVDLHGFPRTVGAFPDIGALEWHPPCIADVNCDLIVDLDDLSMLLSHFGLTQGARSDWGDMDGDGAIDLCDLCRLLQRFGSDCRP
ncbi:MAG: hypothetical protein IT450_19305 [Phycisphaerales bacterium]|nr:hypothetical protein [Phycisphaerales bacterium]